MKWDEFLPISELDTGRMGTLAGFGGNLGIWNGRWCFGLEMRFQKFFEAARRADYEIPSAKAHLHGAAFSER
jgi:hypothetical protein